MTFLVVIGAWLLAYGSGHLAKWIVLGTLNSISNENTKRREEEARRPPRLGGD